MNSLYVSPAFVVCYANDNDALVPELWAMEGLLTLDANMVMGGLVYRDYSPLVANFGDVVNAHRPSSFRMYRKTDADAVTAQDVTTTNVQVPLNQHGYVTFVIKDGEASKSFKELVQLYVEPAMKAIAAGVDRTLIGQVHKFLGGPTGRAGGLGALSSTTAKAYMLEAAEIMNGNLAPMDGRNLILSPAGQTAVLGTDLFVAASNRGDGGSALESAIMGRLYGMGTYMSQHVPSIRTGAETVAGTITSAAAAGATGSQNCTVTGYEANVGEFATVAGNNQPTHLTAVTASTNTTAITLNEALKNATAEAAVLTVYKACDVAGDYAVGYSKTVLVDGWAAGCAPQVGQLIAFGTSTNRRTYTIIESWLSDTGVQSLILDRPLEVALSNNDLAFPGPYGSFNFLFHREALALVNRPLALPSGATGVLAGTTNLNNISMRVAMQYDSANQGTRVTLDLLYGVAVLNSLLGVVVCG